MRVLASWPMATLLIGVAALMGINAATSPGQAAPEHDVSDAVALDQAAPAAGCSEPKQSECAILAAIPCDQSIASMPVQLTEAASSQVDGAPQMTAESSPPQPEYGSLGVESVAWTVITTPATTTPAQTGAKACGNACCQQAAVSDAAKGATAKCATTKCATTKCATAQCATTQCATTQCPATQCPATQCATAKCDAKKTCPLDADNLAAGNVVDEWRAFTDEPIIDDQPFSNGDSSAASSSHPPHFQSLAMQETEESEWQCPQDQAINLEVHAIAAGPEQNPFAVFGKQAALAEHLAMLHQRLGELEGEASTREATMELTKVNAEMAAKLEAMEELHALMDGMVRKSIEMAEMKAEQRMQSLHAAYAMQAPTVTLPEPQDPSEPPQVIAEVQTESESAPNAELNNLRRENQQLRKQLESLRKQVAKIIEAAPEPKTVY